MSDVHDRLEVWEAETMEGQAHDPVTAHRIIRQLDATSPRG